MQRPSHVYIFSYGSNMCVSRMQSRVSTAETIGVGFVSHREFRFHKRSRDGSAKADAAFTGRKEDRVWGVVYQVDALQKPLLDKHEFLGVGYDHEEVDVELENGRLRAWIYVARPETFDPALLPYCWYLAYIQQGAAEHQLPSAYRDFLAQFSAIPDPNAQRRQENEQTRRK